MNSLSKKSRSLSILKVVQHAAQKTNVFDKSRAEPNKFELCRAKKRHMDMNIKTSGSTLLTIQYIFYKNAGVQNKPYHLNLSFPKFR